MPIIRALTHPFSKLTVIYLFWIVASILSSVLFEVYFFGLGMGIQEIVSTGIFWFIGSLLMIPLFKRIHLKNFMLFGILIGALSAILLYYFKATETAFLFRFLLGLTHFFFWVPFNIAFFGFGKENNAALGAVYYSVGPLLALVLPGFSGFIAGTLGYESVYLLALITYVMTFALTFLFLDGRTYEYDFVKSIKSIAGLRTLVFLEGMAPHVVTAVVIEAMLLKYATTPLEFGVFISFATVFAVAASIVTARLSDQQKRRREFIIVSAVCFGAAMILASSAPDIATFFIGVSLIGFAKAVFFPLPIALVIDNSKDLAHTMIGREFVLNAGRVAGAILGTVLLFYYDISFVLFINGIIMLFIYPFVFEIKKIKLMNM